MNQYYLKHTSNIHRGDYDFAIQTNKLYDHVRDIISKFVNCESSEVVYTSGATMSMNMVVFGYMKNHLKKDMKFILMKQ
jgi:cysteine desulfurase/selenocysteine lyase